MSGLSLLFLGPLRRYAGVKAEDVVTFMIKAAKKDAQGVFIYPSELLHQD